MLPLATISPADAPFSAWASLGISVGGLAFGFVVLGVFFAIASSLLPAESKLSMPVYVVFVLLAAGVLLLSPCLGDLANGDFDRFWKHALYRGGALLVGGLVLPILTRTPVGSMAGSWQYGPFIVWTIWDTVASYGAPERWALRVGL